MPHVFEPSGPVPAPPVGRTWEGLMDMAIALAHKGADAGETPVGALLTGPDGRILAQAHNAPIRLHDPTAHAEILALRAAGKMLHNYRLNNCTLIVTLEPCPMCAAALVQARVGGLVFGAADARAGAVISRAEYLDVPFCNHKVWHMGGIRAQACADLLRDFFAARRATG